MEDTAISKDGYMITLRLERRYSKSVGADFVTGGLHDYRSTTEEGFYLTVRGGPSKDAKKLVECIRSSIKSLTGNFPSVMPPTKASGIIEFIFDSRLSEAEIMNSIMSAISVTELGVSPLAPLTPERISTKEQEPSFAPPRRIRPIGVSVISVTWIVIGFLDALVGTVLAAQWTYHAYSSSSVTSAVLAAIGGLAYIVGGLGLLNGKSWAYRYNIILCVISTIFLISVWIPVGVGNWVAFLFMILNIFALSYLILPSTRTFFSAKYTEPPIRYGSKLERVLSEKGLSESGSGVSQQQVQLKVLEAYTRDIGRGVARMDYNALDALGSSTGDVVEIRQKRRTVAKCLPLYPSDEGKSIIRIDGLIRSNAGVAIGDVVTVRKVKAPPAEKVVVAPLEAVPPIDERYLADALESVPVTKGDNIMIPYYGGRLVFQVIGVSPAAEAALITEGTTFEIAEGEALRVTYENIIGGLKDEIQKVREMIVLPLRHPEIFEKLGVEAPKGVLLYGRTGTGKTLLAETVATESNAHFISISGPEIMGKHYGESEQRLREVFKEAKEKAPSIIFIDQIDSIAPKREERTGEVEKRVVSQLLTLMDGLKSREKVFVIGATNRPDLIDPALKRPGRFDREIEIKVPDKKGRLEILQIHTRHMPLAQDVDLEKLASVTDGFVGADLEHLCKEAAMKTLRKVLPDLELEEERISPEVLDKLIVTMADFEDALKEITPKHPPTS